MGAAGFTPGGFPFLGPAAARRAKSRSCQDCRQAANAGASEKASIGLSRIRKTGVDAGPELAAAALGKLAHMPYVWLPAA
jgi:hypothetical protein